MSSPDLSVFAVKLDGNIECNDPIADLIFEASTRRGLVLHQDDVVVVTHKIVSKAEGRVASMAKGDQEARDRLVAEDGATVLRRRGGVLITRTRHGFVCASAGIDASNVHPGTVTLLPEDPDRSARRIRGRLNHLAGVDVAVIICDTFGRAWRLGQTNVAIGVAGILPTINYRDSVDTFGTVLGVTNIAVADEIASAAEMVMGKAEGIPVAIVRGSAAIRGRGSVSELIRPPADDLFL